MIFPIIMTLSLTLIIYEDFKDRAIHLGFLILFIIISMMMGFWDGITGIEVLINISFFAFLLLVLTIYFSIKEKKWTNITKEYLGLGDIVFFLGLCFLFPFIHLLLYFIGALIFTIILYGITKKMMQHDNIPLAGMMSILLIILIWTSYILNWNLMDTTSIYQFLQ